MPNFTSRYKKEFSLYGKEVDDLGKKLDKGIAQGAEDWDIKNAVRADGSVISQ